MHNARDGCVMDTAYEERNIHEEGDIQGNCIRERYWLEQLLDLDAWPVLFICGSPHIETFRSLLKSHDIVVQVLCER